VGAGHARDRDREDRQRRGVVDQRLAGQHAQHAAAEPQLAPDRDRADRVRRRDDRAEDQRRAARQARDEELADEPDRERRDDDQPDAEHQDRPELAEERRDREPDRRRVQQRRQHDAEDDVGVQLQPRHARDERRRQRDDRDHQRRLPALALRERVDRDRTDDDQHELQAVHRDDPTGRLAAPDGRQPASRPGGRCRWAGDVSHDDPGRRIAAISASR
jgi:hypothetical protein